MIDVKNILKQTLITIFNIIGRIIFYFSTYSIKPFFNKHNTIYKQWSEEQRKACFENFKKYFNKSIFINGNSIREFSIKRALKNTDDGIFLEFGIYKGESTKLFSKYTKTLYAFDSFEGLEEDWLGFNKPIGKFDLKGNLPNLPNNVELIVGKVQNTLKKFLESKNDKKIKFVHMDLDTYESSKFVLKNIKPYLSNNCIIFLFSALQ